MVHCLIVTPLCISGMATTRLDSLSLLNSILENSYKNCVMFMALPTHLCATENGRGNRLQHNTSNLNLLVTMLTSDFWMCQWLGQSYYTWLSLLMPLCEVVIELSKQMYCMWIVFWLFRSKCVTHKNVCTFCYSKTWSKLLHTICNNNMQIQIDLKPGKYVTHI